jgi:hypothetical protein
MVGALRAALTVALTVVGAVSCASAAPEQDQPRAPISSGPQSTGPPISASASRLQQDAIPESLRAACGHPGAEAELTAVPITVPKAQCDLTGVVVRYGGIGVTVPSDGGVFGVADGISSSPELSATVDPTTGDVTLDGSVS